MSEAKRAAAIENLKKAVAANKARSYGIWKCATCSKEAPATAHQMRKTYCSKACMAEGYKSRLTGERNPNYRNASVRNCRVCSKEFHSYQKDRKYCGMKCRDQEADQLRTNAKKDANHQEMVQLLTAGGAVVKDMSRAMFGIPDLIVWHLGAWHLVEIKNPKTQYGKKGLNKIQEKWATDWQGGPVFIIRTSVDVGNFIAGAFHELESVGGYIAVVETVEQAIAAITN